METKEIKKLKSEIRKELKRIDYTTLFHLKVSFIPTENGDFRGQIINKAVDRFGNFIIYYTGSLRGVLTELHTFE
nr:hypothetical protein [uncultured Prevotella sp.]